MANSLICTAISIAAQGAKIGVAAGRVGLTLALIPAKVASNMVTTVGEEGNKLLERADHSLDETSRKCGL